MSEQEMKTENEKEKNGTKEIETISPICRRDCKVCNSGFIEEIHSMKKAGATYMTICASLKANHDYDISPASIARHMTNYKEHQQLHAAKMMNATILDEASEIARHTMRVVSLIDQALDDIDARMKAGILKLDVGELGKLFEIRHKILTGKANEDEMGTMLTIFQKAESKYGMQMNINQAVLFNN